MNRLVTVAVLSIAALAVLPRATSAQTTPPPTYTFTAVDSFEIMTNYDAIIVRGVQEGASTGSDVRINVSQGDKTTQAARLESCQRLALLAMTKPGAYLFQITPATTYNWLGCALKKN